MQQICPEIDPGAFTGADTATLVAALRRVVAAHPGIETVIHERRSLAAFCSDALFTVENLPQVAVLPENAREVAACLAVCSRLEVPVVPRGAGTGLSGGATPHRRGVLIVTTRLNKICAIDAEAQTARVQAGVCNDAVSAAAAASGLFYAPDPSSQSVSTIGGNIAENAGGLHCVKYGMTTDNLLSVQLALADGSLIEVGGEALEPDGLDLLGIIAGSEGLLGIVTEATLRLLPRPESSCTILIGFSTVAAAGEAVVSIIRCGAEPAGLEMMDQAMINAAEDFIPSGYPREAAAVLLVGLDGPAAELESRIARLRDAVAGMKPALFRVAHSAAAQLRIWRGRKSAFPIAARLAPDYIVMDGSVPRSRLTVMLETIKTLADAAGLQVINVFHAGDGNLHPLILFDATEDGALTRAQELGFDILRACIAHDGVLSGEHGIGIEKRALMSEVFTPAELTLQQNVKCAFDPAGLMNPGKVYPALHRCAEHGMAHNISDIRPDLPRF